MTIVLAGRLKTNLNPEPYYYAAWRQADDYWLTVFSDDPILTPYYGIGSNALLTTYYYSI